MLGEWVPTLKILTFSLSSTIDCPTTSFSTKLNIDVQEVDYGERTQNVGKCICIHKAYVAVATRLLENVICSQRAWMC